MPLKTMERIHLTKADMQGVEQNIRFHEHLRRYAAIRRFCYGKVLDFASGCGYGSFLISQNPDVERVYGVDIDEEAVKWAKNEFSNIKTEFLQMDINNFKEQVDTLVSLETVEHLDDVSLYSRLASRCNIQQIILSFPDKKSTHFNKFHKHDFVIQDMLDLFKDYVAYHQFKTGDVQFILFLRKPEKMPHHIVRNLLDI